MTLFESLAIIALMQSGSAVDDMKEADVVTDVKQCQSISDPMERLACFDRATKVLEEATESREVIVIEKKEIEETKRRRFGLSLPDLGIFGGDDDDTDRVNELTTTVSKAKEFGYKQWQLELADGTVWHTTEPENRLRPRSGDSVLIKRAALGSFLASIDDDPFVRIKRVK
ncbi:hypothetical protein ACRAQ6_06980 [Erythrobacter sp. HA6-11]